ncbi:MAG: alpha/beta hydrolase [bacterium]|nr:alpha/beta hydrolase [bacterium]
MRTSTIPLYIIGGIGIIAAITLFIIFQSIFTDPTKLDEDIQTQINAPVTIARDISYGSDNLQTFDLHYRETNTNAPVVLLVHGGSEDEGDKQKVVNRISTYTDIGFIVANTNFRYSEEGFEYDIACALSHLVSIAPVYGGDNSQFLVHGYSLGGVITSRMIYEDTVDWLNNCSSQEPYTIVGYYGESTHFGNLIPEGVDVTISPFGSEIIAPLDYLATQENLYDDVKINRSGMIARDGAINYVDPNDPPALLIVGSEDPKNDEQRQEDFAAVLRASGINAFTHVVNGGDHSLHNEMRPGVTRLIQRFANHIMRGAAFKWQ